MKRSIKKIIKDTALAEGFGSDAKGDVVAVQGELEKAKQESLADLTKRFGNPQQSTK